MTENTNEERPINHLFPERNVRKIWFSTRFPLLVKSACLEYEVICGWSLSKTDFVSITVLVIDTLQPFRSSMEHFLTDINNRVELEELNQPACK